MTEAEWLACDDPEAMLRFFHGFKRQIMALLGWQVYMLSNRKRLLFSCAACCHFDKDDKAFATSVELIERYADEASGRGAHLGPDSSLEPDDDLDEAYGRVEVVAVAARAGFFPFATQRWEALIILIMDSMSETDLKDQCAAQAQLLRDIAGNPFRLPQCAANWSNPSIAGLAQTIYADRTFDRLPILADALEDAGCTDVDILAHCRGPGPHVRGCWVVDLLTGRS